MKFNQAFLNESKFITNQIANKNKTSIINPENLKTFDHTSVCMDEGSIMTLNGCLELNAGCYENNGRSTIVRMDRFAKLNVSDGVFKVFYGGDIHVSANATLNLGARSIIGADCVVRCGKNVTIGDECVISHNVVIEDSDFHSIITADGEESPKHGEKGITIRNHVWIGSRAMILKDVTIGEGAIISAGAVVTEDVPAHTMVAGNPAKVIKENVDWK